MNKNRQKILKDSSREKNEKLRNTENSKLRKKSNQKAKKGDTEANFKTFKLTVCDA